MAIDIRECPKCGVKYNGTEFGGTCPWCSGGKKQVKRDWNPFRRRQPVPAENEPEQPAQNEMSQVTPTKKLEQSEKSKIGKTKKLSDRTMFEDPDDKGEIREEDPKDRPEIREEDSDNPDEKEILQDPKRPTDENTPSVTGRIDKISKTLGRVVVNISEETDEIIYPVVGWLVCVKGVYYGKGFPLRSGINKISREMLPRDMSVSRSTAIKIVYDAINNAFFAEPSDDAMSYINGKWLKASYQLEGYEKIWLGDSMKNEFLFIPACGEHFVWSDYSNQEGISK